MKFNVAAMKFVRRTYVYALLFGWVFFPEVSRVLTWAVGLKVNIFNVLPLLGLLPGFFLLHRHWSDFGRLYRAMTIVWTLAFGYAFLMAFAYGQLLSGAFDGLQFVGPLLIAPLLMVTGDDTETLYERVASTLLWFAAASSAYGLFQYVAPPAWDVLWLQNLGSTTSGQAIPFGLRIFATLNLAGVFAAYLALTIAFNFPRITVKKPLTCALVGVCLLALFPTLVRTEWFALTIAIVTYSLLSPRRGALIGGLLAVVAIGVISGAVLLSVVSGSDAAVTSISDRFDSINDLKSDDSVMDRQDVSNEAFLIGIREPLGQGLGTVGTSTKLAEAGETTTLDNGYLARLYEMGVFGVVMYVLVLLAAFGGAIALYTRALRSGDLRSANVAAAMIAMQMELLFADGAADQHLALPGVFFWISAFFVSRGLAETSPAVAMRLGVARTFARRSAAPSA